MRLGHLSILRHATAAVGLGLLCLLLSPTARADTVPYDLAKFRPVLDDSKLQAPTSSPALIARGDFAGQDNEYFFLDPTGEHLVFTVSGESNRSELRQESGDWQTSAAVEQVLSARVSLPLPETDTLNQFTFMQIHDTNDGLNKPLIRLTWQRERLGQTDHLWAAIRTPDDFDQPISNDNLSGFQVDLGPRPLGFFDAVIAVQNNQMTVELQGQTVIDMDVSYWDGLDNYFKAGVYLQDPGRATAVFDQLAYRRLVPEPTAAAALAMLSVLSIGRSSRRPVRR